MDNIIFKTVLLKGEAGNNIGTIEKTSTAGLIDTYTITLTDGSTTTFEVKNGSNIASINKTATQGYYDTYTITLTDGSTTTFEVKNGENGSELNLAPVEHDIQSASRAYTVDDRVVVDGFYYKVIAPIEEGESFRDGDNIDPLQVCDEIQEVREEVYTKAPRSEVTNKVKYNGTPVTTINFQLNGSTLTITTT